MMYLQIRPWQYPESYSDNSICVDTLKTLSSHSCGTYIRKPRIALCAAQETYRVNGNNRYALQLKGTYISSYLHVVSIPCDLCR